MKYEGKKGKVKGSRQPHILNKTPFHSSLILGILYASPMYLLLVLAWENISFGGWGALFPFLRIWGKAPFSQEAKVQRVLLEITAGIHFSHLRLVRRDLSRPKSTRGQERQGIKCTIPLAHANKHTGEKRCTAL